MVVPTLKESLWNRPRQPIAADVQRSHTREIPETGRNLTFEVIEREAQTYYKRTFRIAVDEVAQHAVPITDRSWSAPAVAPRPSFTTGSREELNKGLAFHR